METEGLFLIFACLMLFFDLIQLSKAKPSRKKKPESGLYAVTLAFGSVAVSYLVFVQAFIGDDFSLKQVFYYSSSSLPALFKVSSTWGGAAGSMLLLTFLVSLVYFVYRFRTHERSSAFRIRVYQLFDCILAFFVIIALMNSPFERFSMAPMEGQGLNPLLQTFWMIVHPPIVFTAYVFILFVCVLTLAGMSVREDEDNQLFKMSLKASWLTTTLGIAIGAVWAYEVLGWGGYWAWDPVETASLLPWLALTAYFHTESSAKGSKSLTKELMLLIAFAAVIFTTALTRGGLAVSVHAYATSPIGPAFLLLALIVATYFFYLMRRTGKPLFAWKIERSSLYSLSGFLAYWSLMLIFLVCFWGLAFPVITQVFLSNPVSTSAAFFSNWNFPFAMTFVAALLGCSVFERIDLRRFALLVVGALGAGIILVQVQWPTPNTLANLGLPLLTVALCAVSYRLASTLRQKTRSFRFFARSLLHFAIVITLVGVFVSSTAKELSEIPTAEPNTTVEALGLQLGLKNFTIHTGTGNVLSPYGPVPEHSALSMNVEVKQGGTVHHGTLWIRLYSLHDVVSTPLILHTWTGDIYVHMHPTESLYNSLVQALLDTQVSPEDVALTVEIIPMVHLVWAGVALMSAAAAMSLAKELVTRIRKRPSGT
jgi:cytochrome c-type biogenesis protein CcmF